MKTYWEDTTKLVTAPLKRPKDGGILVIGSGLAGVSVAYHLQRTGVFDQVSIVDCGTKNASYFRNAGHILLGTGESYKAMTSVHGEDITNKVMIMSKSFIREIEKTVKEHNITDAFNRSLYYRIALDDVEAKELYDSVMMQSQDEIFWTDCNPEGLMLKEIKGAYVCPYSAYGNPVKLRNGVLEVAKQSGVEHNSYKVGSVEEVNGRVKVTYRYDGEPQVSWHDAVVLCTNGYSQQIGGFFQNKKTIEPFKGQVIVSKQDSRLSMKTGPFSIDHGYIYGTFLPDNRLLIGGWRNNVPGGEIGCTNLNINKDTEEGLKQFVRDNFTFGDELDVGILMAGIMGSSTGGLPHVGPTDSDLIYTCAGFSGYGFGWAHGAAKLCADIMAGNRLISGWELLKPR
ncbi:uncharacterized protein LOC135830346 [Sycon ciliatum]|uniref:uncharacterized protein LOC135830346 n=1 Tax=Sycon ciliatum TaxID=27933 RepID=UPI0031F6BD18